MDKISELKEIIVNLKMELVKAEVYNGICPYTFYPLPDADKGFDCSIGCNKCRENFLSSKEKDIRAEVENL